jgi:3-deoxy-7-phosphoheptulonate synthase
MIIKFKAQIKESQVKTIQQSLNVFSKLIVIEDAWALILGVEKISFDQIPEQWIDEIIQYSDKLYFVKHTSRKSSPIQIGNITIGGKNVVSIAGPCSIESEQQIFESAKIVKKGGGQILRGGAFKPRSSCYDFQGLGLEGVQLIFEASRAYGLLSVTEIMDVRDLDKMLAYVDIIQVGARNMQNFSLLKELGLIKKPILLKRGLSATYQEFLSSAEYILSLGNQEVILCERGIRTYETALRNTLDISAVPYLKSKTHCPVIVDPSHACGLRHFVPELAYAALVVGADGIMVEVHPNPDESVSDAKQTLHAQHFYQMNQKLRDIAALFEKSYGAHP